MGGREREIKAERKTGRERERQGDTARVSERTSVTYKGSTELDIHITNKRSSKKYILLCKKSLGLA